MTPKRKDLAPVPKGLELVEGMSTPAILDVVEGITRDFGYIPTPDLGRAHPIRATTVSFGYEDLLKVAARLKEIGEASFSRHSFGQSNHHPAIILKSFYRINPEEVDMSEFNGTFTFNYGNLYEMVILKSKDSISDLGQLARLQEI